MTQRTPFIAGNWKMHRTPKESVALAREMVAKVGSAKGVEVAIAPTFTALQAVGEALAGSGVKLAAQNVHFEAQGAFTGEISAPMLREVGCAYAIIGHSERRQYFGETDEVVAKRARAAIAQGLGAIVCVGELLAEREAGKTLEVIERQLRGGLSGMSADEAKNLVIAYEPVWAIGTGKVATPAQAQEVHAAIRKLLSALFGGDRAATIPIQYGGSVKGSNAAELLGQPDIDGALVGGASLDPADFSRIVEAAKARCC